MKQRGVLNLLLLDIYFLIFIKYITQDIYTVQDFVAKSIQ